MSDVVSKYYEKLFDLMLSPTGKIHVNTDYHGQVEQVHSLLKNDKTAIVSPILEYMINSGTVDINFEANNSNLTKIFNFWKQNVNADLNVDIPRGLRSFTEQYFRERWTSSFIVVRIKWDKINGYIIPSRMWIMDGASIFVKNEKGSLNTNEYYFGSPDSKKTNLLKNTNTETILIRKPYNALYDQYPTPYLVKRGALYHALFKAQVLNRQAEIINTAFPYQMFIKAGCEEAMRRNAMPTQADLDDLADQFKAQKKDFDSHVFSKGLVGAFPFDVKFEELIPSYDKALDEKILKGTDRNILNALGMIELKGFSSTREEAILNPKVLIEEVNNGVADYVELLNEIVLLTQEKNNTKYTMNDKVDVTSGIIEGFVTDEMRAFLRSLYDRGLISKEDGLESTTSLNFKTQVIKRKNEKKNKIDLVMYPQIVQNYEDKENIDEVPDDKKPGTPEANNFKSASEECICEKCGMVHKLSEWKDGNELRECDCGYEINNKGKVFSSCMESEKDIPLEIAKELSDAQKEVFVESFNKKFAECTTLEYDAYLREKVSMEFAAKSALEYVEAPKVKKRKYASKKKK